MRFKCANRISTFLRCRRAWQQAKRALDTLLTAGVGLNQAAVDRKAVAADKTLFDAAAQHRLEHMPQQVALAKAAMAPSASGDGQRNSEEQAPVVRSIFEMFASGRFGLVTISRSLEERRVPTRMGRPQWNRNHIKSMLRNETYAGTRYFNRITAATEASRKGTQVIRGRWVYRDRAEWIPVTVPAIVPRELFETVREKLRLHEERYCQPVTHYPLQGLVQCGVCGSRCSSSRRYQKVVRPSGTLSVYHRAVYRCNRRAQENMHDRTRIERCRNAEIGTHILEGKVFGMIREIMLDPAKLRGCIDTGGRFDDRSIARELARIAGEIRALDEKRRHLINRYAVEQMTGEAYITANRGLDRVLERLIREKAELVAALRSPQHEDFVDASIRQFCASANARFQACADFDTKRQFLVTHIERVIYNRYKVTIAGSVPVQSASGETKLQFRIEGEIDQKAVRLRPRTIRPEDGRKERREVLTITAVEPWPNVRSKRRSGLAKCGNGPLAMCRCSRPPVGQETGRFAVPDEGDGAGSQGVPPTTVVKNLAFLPGRAEGARLNKLHQGAPDGLESREE